MDWQSIVVPVAVAAATALVSWGLTLLTALIKGKIGNETLARYLSGAVGIVDNAVKATYQTYVQSLKEAGEFDKDAQLAALEKALTLNQPVVIDCQIDSDDKVWPMVAPGTSISEAFDEEDMAR